MRQSHTWRGRRAGAKAGVAVAMVVLVGAAGGLYLGLTGETTGGAKRPARSLSAGAPVRAATSHQGPPCPLTGVPTSGAGVPQRPAIAVKVDNYPTARPQSGLDHADIVFEEPVEGGITRLVAVFQCHNANLVGPVRSARQPDVGILDELSRPIFVHVGGIAPILNLIDSANAINEDLFYDGSLVQHLPGRVAPYDTYVSTASVWKRDTSDTSPPAPLFTYSATPLPGTAISSLKVPFSVTNDNTWTWNARSGQWLLTIGGQPATVLGGSRIGVANVVVMAVQVSTGPWVENAQGAHEVEVNPTSGGALEVLRNGVMIAGTWKRSSESQAAQLVAANGAPIALAPGETWIELLPSSVSTTSTPASAGS